MSDRFVVSARKYRPDNFKDLLGQDAISITLRRAISHHKTAHAYLFCGPRGVGKTSAARIFATAINCLSPAADGESCSVCESCKAFEEQRSINIYELDAASNNSTEDIRRLINEVSVPPQFGRYKVYIIDEVHMLSQGAFNAFLKTLEEPPPYVVFILATTEKQKILPTILSRCQVFDFKPIPPDVIVGQLTNVGEQEGIPTEQKALELIAKQADGGMRDALSLFDRIAGFGNGRVTYEQTVESLHVLSERHFFRFADFIRNNDASGILYLLDELVGKGFDAKTILIGLQDFFRKLMLAYDSTTLGIAKLTEEEKAEYTKLAQDLGRSFLYKALFKLSEAEKGYRTGNAKRLLVEMALLGLTNIANTPATQVATSQSSGITNTRPSIASEQKGATMAPKEEPLPTKTASSQTQVSSSHPSSGATASSGAQSSPPASQVAESQRDRKPSGVKLVSINQKASRDKEGHGSAPISTSEDKPRNPQMPSPAITPKEALDTAPKGDKTVAAPRKVLLSNETIIEAWLAYVDNKIPKEQILSQTLFRKRKVTYEENEKFSVEVLSEIQKGEFEKLIPDILSFMQQHLGASKLTMEIKVAAQDEKTAILSNAEWIKQEQEQNSALKTLFSTLDLRQI